MVHLHFSTSTIVKSAIGCGVLGGIYMQPYRPMVVVGESMEPTYRSQSFCWTEPVPSGGLKVGEVIVIDMKGGPIVKRVAFLPGDKVQQVKINDKWVDLIDVHVDELRKQEPGRFRDFVIPPGMVYVLGDNSEVSLDSRKFGCVPMSDVESKLVDQRPSARW